MNMRQGHKGLNGVVCFFLDWTLTTRYDKICLDTTKKKYIKVEVKIIHQEYISNR